VIAPAETTAAIGEIVVDARGLDAFALPSR